MNTADASVAELESRIESAELETREAEETLAIAMIDASDMREALRLRVQRAETEAASLRLELAVSTNIAEAHARESRELRAELQAEKDRRVEHRQMNQALNEQVQKLSAEVEREKAQRRGAEGHESLAASARFDAEARLAAATDLLKRGHSPFENRDQYLAWYEDVGAFLASQPKAERTDHERAVFVVRGETLTHCNMRDLELLKEMDAVPTRTLQNVNPLGDWAGVAKAELARREAEK